MHSSEELGSTFGRAWRLLAHNWILIVPGIVIGIVTALVVWILGAFGLATTVGFSTLGYGGAGSAAALLSAIVLGIVAVLAIILNVAYTTGMAGAAWRTGIATFADGSEAFRLDAASILVAVVLLAVIGIIAAALAPFTFGLSMLAFAIFFLYTFASVIVGQRSGVDAIGESCRIAARNFGMTLAVVILLFIAFLIAGWLQNLLQHVRVIGWIVGYIIEQVVVAYATLVVVGEYIKLRRTVDTVGVGSPPPASPPPPTA
jgi:hypothetical protein